MHPVVVRLRDEFQPLADPERAQAMRAYMKDISPFLGIPAAPRRAAQRRAWRGLEPTDRADLATAVDELLAQPERDYHYAAIEWAARWPRLIEPHDLSGTIRSWLLTVPWWDTIDSWQSLVINPLIGREPELVAVMWDWNGDDNQWLIRISIQHQRGRKEGTDLPLLFALCEPHIRDPRFFVAKAIGWALRDAAAVDPSAVTRFLAAHPGATAVARREAIKGIDRSIGRRPG